MKTEDIIKELKKYPGLDWEVMASENDKPFTGLVSGYTGSENDLPAQVFIGITGGED